MKKLNLGCGMPINGNKEHPDWICGDFLEEDRGEDGQSYGHYYYCDRCNKLIKEAGEKLI